MEDEIQLFLSYAREDADKVEQIYTRLLGTEAAGTRLKPWMDQRDLLPGELWKRRIEEAIRRSDFFLACISANSATKRGYLLRELRDALDIWQEYRDTDIYLIPVRLEDCQVPEALQDFQWVDLFREDGWSKLFQAFDVGMERRGKTARAKPVIKRREYQSMTKQIELAGNKPTTEVLLKDLVRVSSTVGRVAEGFNLGPEEEVIRISRLKKGNDVPFAIHTVYLKPEYCPGILEEDLTGLTDLYAAKYDCRVVNFDEVLHSAMPSDEEARLLELLPHEIVIIRDRISYDQRDRPFEVLHAVDCVATNRYEDYAPEIATRLRTIPSLR